MAARPLFDCVILEELIVKIRADRNQAYVFAGLYWVAVFNYFFKVLFNAFFIQIQIVGFIDGVSVNWKFIQFSIQLR